MIKKGKRKTGWQKPTPEILPPRMSQEDCREWTRGLAHTERNVTFSREPRKGQISVSVVTGTLSASRWDSHNCVIQGKWVTLLRWCACVYTCDRRHVRAQRTAGQRRSASGWVELVFEVKISVPAWYVQGWRGYFPGYMEMMGVLNAEDTEPKDTTIAWK